MYCKIGDLTDFQRGEVVVGAHLAGASVIKTATLFGVSRATVSKVMMAHINHWKTSSVKRNSGRKLKLNNWDRRTSKTTV
jgi:hypothetical protein